jgi:hypothetical protein
LLVTGKKTPRSTFRPIVLLLAAKLAHMILA